MARAGAAEVEQGEVEVLAPPGPEEDPDRATDRAAVPDQSRTGEEVAEQVVLDVAVVLEDEIEPGADQAAEQGGEADLVGPVDRLAELIEPPPEQRAGGEKGEGEADPEGLESQGADVDLGQHRDGRLVEAP